MNLHTDRAELLCSLIEFVFNNLSPVSHFFVASGDQIEHSLKSGVCPFKQLHCTLRVVALGRLRKQIELALEHHSKLVDFVAFNRDCVVASRNCHTGSYVQKSPH